MRSEEADERLTVLIPASETDLQAAPNEPINSACLPQRG